MPESDVSLRVAILSIVPNRLLAATESGTRQARRQSYSAKSVWPDRNQAIFVRRIMFVGWSMQHFNITPPWVNVFFDKRADCVSEH